MFHILTGFVHVCPVPVCCEAVSYGPWTVNESGRFRSISFLVSKTNTWSPTDRSIGQKLQVSTLQNYNLTCYSINAYTFIANTTFNRSVLPPICIVIWIYFLYYSPWHVGIWRRKWLFWFPGIGRECCYRCHFINIALQSIWDRGRIHLIIYPPI